MITLFCGRHVGVSQKYTEYDYSILGCINLCKGFHEYLKLRKTHRFQTRRLLYYSPVTSQFLDLIYRMVFELFFYCVTVQAKNSYGALLIQRTG